MLGQGKGKYTVVQILTSTKSFHATETRINSDQMGNLAQLLNLPLLTKHITYLPCLEEGHQSWELFLTFTYLQIKDFNSLKFTLKPWNSKLPLIKTTAKIVSWSNTKFSKVTSQEMYGTQRGKLLHRGKLLMRHWV